MKRFILALFAAAIAVLCANGVSAAVVTFDDLSGSGQVADGYAGITWNDQWAYYDTEQSPYTAHSASQRVFNFTSAGDRPEFAGFNFSAPVIFDGAWFSGYDFALTHFDLYYLGNLVATSAAISPSATPTFLSSGYSGLVDEVLVHGTLNQGIYNHYVMDDVTYHPADLVPEPGSLVVWSLLAVGATVATWWRRRQAAC